MLDLPLASHTETFTADGSPPKRDISLEAPWDYCDALFFFFLHVCVSVVKILVALLNDSLRSAFPV